MFVAIRLLFALHLSISFSVRLTSSQPLKILINSPTFAHAHSTFQASLARKLAAEGHNVTILTVKIYPQLNYIVPTYNDSGINVININRVSSPTSWSVKILSDPFNGHQNMFTDGNFAVFGKTIVEVCDEVTGDRVLMDQLKHSGFDVGISEEFDMCGFGVLHYAGIKTKIMSNTIALYLSIANIYGIPLPPSYVPNLAASSEDAPYMSFINRARALFYDTIETEFVAKSAI